MQLEHHRVAKRVCNLRRLVLVGGGLELDVHPVAGQHAGRGAAVARCHHADHARLGARQRVHRETGQRRASELEASVGGGRELAVAEHVAVREQVVVAGVVAHHHEGSGDRRLAAGVHQAARDGRRREHRRRQAGAEPERGPEARGNGGGAVHAA